MVIVYSVFWGNDLRNSKNFKYEDEALAFGSDKALQGFDVEIDKEIRENGKLKTAEIYHTIKAHKKRQGSGLGLFR